jgi:transposase
MVPRKNFTEEQVKDIIKRYSADKETLKQIAKLYGVSWSVIRRVLLERGIRLRKTTYQEVVVTEEQIKSITQMHRNGRSIQEISQTLEIGIRKISRVITDSGSNARVEAARRRRRLNRSQKEKIAIDYKEGASQKELAQQYNVSIPTIKTALREQEAEIRTMGEAMGGLSEKQKEEVARLYTESKLTTVEIGRIFGVSDSSIGKYLNALEVERRTQAEVYGGFTEEEEKEVIKKYFEEEMLSTEIAELFGKSYQTVERVIEKSGFTKRTLGQSLRLKTERELDIDDICRRYKNLESSISIANDYDLTYPTIIRILEYNGIEIRGRGILGDSIAHALKQSGNFRFQRKTDYYVYTLRDYPGQLKPGITFDDKSRRSISKGQYGKRLIWIPYPSRIEAYFLEQAVFKETRSRWDPPDELLESGWEGAYELRKMPINELEEVIDFYQEQLHALGAWAFASQYVPMTEEERRQCIAKSEGQEEQEGEQ